MKDILSFIVNIPWFVWLFIAWVWIYNVWRIAKTMTPQESQELQDKQRRKMLGLD